jgi:amino acid adenylation domain-containing protein
MNLYQNTFHQSAQNYPNNIALWTEDKCFTYQALENLTLKWSNIIQQNNRLNLPVAVYGGKQWQMYAGILAVLAAKSTYVPLNKKQPVSRNKVVLSQIDCELLLVAQNEDPSELLRATTHALNVIYLGDDEPQWLTKHPQHCCFHVDGLINDSSNSLAKISTEQAKYAYILFTSGSTGTPKGIAVNQANIINHIARLDELLGIKPTDKVGQFFELSFDLSIHDLFSCWAKGAALYVIPTNQLFCPTHFIKQYQLTVFSAVASVLSFIDKFGLLTPEQLPSLRLSCFGGEKLLTEQAIKWQACANNSRVLNLYGPTEFTITATYFQLDKTNPPSSASIPIGKPLPNLTAILVKDEKQILTSNTLAELYLSGDQLVDGYWQDDQKTAQVFINIEKSENDVIGNKLVPGRYYRTGDIVYYDDNKNLVFHGRNDHQFKVSGHRVEAADIETCIVDFCADITWCTVKAIVDEHDQQTIIIAFIENSLAMDIQKLRDHCSFRLPSYMVPDKFNFFEYLPRNGSGKVDFNALIEAT